MYILYLQNIFIQISHISSVAVITAKTNKPVTSDYCFEQCSFNASGMFAFNLDLYFFFHFITL